MLEFLPINGPVIADTVYIDDKLVARDVTVSLPEITPVMADLQAMGTMSFPIWQLLENMEAAITKIGVDLGLRSMIKPDMKPLEFRWVQTQINADGVSKEVGCKAFLRAIPNKIPGISLSVGETSEGECTFTVKRYNLFVGGERMLLVDRLAGIVNIGGTDYAAKINSML